MFAGKLHGAEDKGIGTASIMCWANGSVSVALLYSVSCCAAEANADVPVLTVSHADLLHAFALQVQVQMQMQMQMQIADCSSQVRVFTCISISAQHPARSETASQILIRA